MNWLIKNKKKLIVAVVTVAALAGFEVTVEPLRSLIDVIISLFGGI